MTERPITVAFLPIYPNPYQHQLAEALAPCGVTVEMLGTMPSPAWLRENVERVSILHLHWLYGIYMSRFRTPLTVGAFWRRLRLAQQLGYRVVWTAHNVLPHRTELWPLHVHIRRRIMREADAVIVHCHKGEAALRERFFRHGPIEVIPIGNLIGLFPLTMSPGMARTALGLPDTAYVYLFLGLLAPYKGVDRLIEAFWQMAREEDRLVIAGKSLSRTVADQAKAAAEADPRIHLHLGHVPDEAMQHYLLSADALVAPYRTVLTSSSAILALSYGLPVIVPSLGCLPETIPAEAGILYDPQVAGALPAAMRAIQARDAQTMRAAAHQKAAELDWNDIGRRTASVYRACLEGDRR
jgi:glycosyltransferase involved in cell wall biosynthesis